MRRTVSEHDLKKRLAGKLTSDEIEKLIDRYVEATSQDDSPNLTIIADLAQKGQEEKLLRVRFNLEGDQYDVLATYFGGDEQSGTFLVKKALEEFISLIT
jgi:hypothetical protein